MKPETICAWAGRAESAPRLQGPCVLAGLLLLAGLSSPAQSAVLLMEDFNDNAASMTKMVAGDATANSINIRLGNNTLNTGGNTGFDQFFGASPNRFLVLGDNAGDLAGEPNGQTFGSFSAARFDLGSYGTGYHGFDVSFDFAFDTNRAPGANGTTRSTDDFFVALLDDSDNLIHELMRFDDVLRNEASRKGTFDQWVNFWLPAASNVHLTFAVVEGNDNSSSAAGIDNLQVIPEPASIALVALGLAGLSAVRVRRRR